MMKTTQMIIYAMKLKYHLIYSDQISINERMAGPLTKSFSFVFMLFEY